jgi:hypothetical protein
MFPTRLQNLLLGILVLSWACLRLPADGVVLKKAAVAQEVRMPDQRAALAWEDGEERLVIETRFVGKGDRFAWIVPLPSVPRIEAVTPGFFPTLVQISAPKVIHDPDAWWGWCLFGGGLLWLLVTLRSTGSMETADWVAIFIAGCGALALHNLLGILAACWVWGFGSFMVGRVRRGVESTLAALLALLVSVIFAGMLLPALAHAGSSVASTRSVEILDRRSVGAYETTVLRGTDTKAVREWLRARGFDLPAHAEPVLFDHFRSGGVLVASQLRNDLTGDDVRAIHPLKFTFPTPKPVYPMRLTGTATPTLELDLYIFGPGTAEIEAMETLSSAAVFRFDPEAQDHRDPMGSLPVGHPGLGALVGGAQWFTHLRGTLTGKSLLRDMEPRWMEPLEKRWVVWSRRGAAIAAANWASLGASVGFAVLALALRFRPSSAAFLNPAAGNIAGASLLLFCGMTFLRPTVPVTPKKHRWIDRFERRARENHIQVFLEDLKNSGTPIDGDAVRKAIAEAYRQAGTVSKGFKPDRELDAPGHHSIEVGTNSIDVLVHDEFGGFQRFSVPRRP